MNLNPSEYDPDGAAAESDPTDRLLAIFFSWSMIEEITYEEERL